MKKINQSILEHLKQSRSFCKFISKLFTLISITHNGGGMVSWGLDTDNLSISRNLINSKNDE